MSYGIRHWKFTAGHTGGKGFWEDFKHHNRVVIGHIYGKDSDLSSITTHEELDEICRRHDKNPRQFHDFFGMKKGDVVACYLKQRFIGLGFITSNKYHYLKKPLDNGYNYHYARDVRWLSDFRTVDLTRYPKAFHKAISGQQITLHEVTDTKVVRELKKWLEQYFKRHPTEKRTIPRPDNTPLLTHLSLKREPPILSQESIAESSGWGIDRTMVFERHQNRYPEGVSMKPVHYDVESRDPAGEAFGISRLRQEEAIFQ